MQISVFTDEISPRSPERAIDLARSWGVTHLEIRSLPGGRFPAGPDSELDDLYRRIAEAGLAVSGVSPGFCKCSWDHPSVAHSLEADLPRACEWAQRWGTDIVSCFAFLREAATNMPAAVIDLLGSMSEITRGQGCKLALENEAGCWGNTGIEAASIIRQVGPERISLCWDPGNSARAGTDFPYPDEYLKIRELVSHVHMKNVDPTDRAWSLIESGVVDWPGQLSALSDDGFTGFLVVETHLHGASDLPGLEQNTLHNLAFVRSCLERL